MVIDYTSNPANNISQTNNLKKLAEAKAEGELEQALSEKQIKLRCS
jgi:hypothetical protein